MIYKLEASDESMIVRAKSKTEARYFLSKWFASDDWLNADCTEIPPEGGLCVIEYVANKCLIPLIDRL